MSIPDTVERERLLYDPPTLDHYLDTYETPFGIKMNVDTSAMQYEIRTAVRYWFGGQQSYRTSERIWSHCEAIENGEWALDDEGNIVYSDEVESA